MFERSKTRKPLWSTSETPGPNVYDIKKGEELIKHRVISPVILLPKRINVRNRDVTPDGGFYQTINENFAKNS